MRSLLHRPCLPQLLAALLLALLALTTTPAAPSAAQTPRVTDVHVLVVAELAALNPTLQITDHITGSCWTGSLANPGRPDAWRCASGSRIYDPCFMAGIQPPAVACLQTPWATETVLLTLEEPLHIPADPAAMLAQQPWALELADGVRRTVATTGAGLSIAGMRVTYGCSDGSSAVGTVDRTEPVWRIFMRARGSWVLVLTPIVVAWY